MAERNAWRGLKGGERASSVVGLIGDFVGALGWGFVCLFCFFSFGSFYPLRGLMRLQEVVAR